MGQIFVSYSRKDNQPLTTTTNGWVTDLRTALVAELGYVNCQVEAWIDVRDIPGNRTFDTQIQQAMNASGALVIIYSENWLSSAYCQHELQEYLKIAGNRDSGRIFLVKKGEVAREKTPKALNRLNGYLFYNPEPPKLELAIASDPESRFRQKLRYLANNIKEVIGDIQLTVVVKQPLKRPRVLLARATPDLLPMQEELFRELKTRGYLVSELSQYRESGAVIEDEWCSKLKDVDATIHLLGALEDPLDNPVNGQPTTLAELQFQLSSGLGKRLRIAWVPTDAAAANVGAAARIRDAKRELGDRLFEALWEETKSEILSALESSPAVDTAAGQESPCLYLVYSKEDEQPALRLATYLHERRVRFEPSLLGGDPEERMEDHQEKLRTSQGILVYWGDATDVWFYQKIRDIRKYALPLPQPRHGRAGCFGDPESVQKQIIQTSVEDDLVIYPSYAQQDFDLGDFIRDFASAADA